MAKILLISIDHIGRTMAGPGIRYWELATSLAKRHQVELWAPGAVDLSPAGFSLKSYTYPFGERFVGRWDGVICQDITPAVVAAAQMAQARIIFDAYDPVLLENLEIHRQASLAQRRKIGDLLTLSLDYALRHCDAIICASEKQRDLWLGAAMALGRLTPELYAADPTLRSLIDIVPFGLQRQRPQTNGAGPRAQFQLKPSDRILLWGGGMWNWFDPLTPIQGMSLLATTRPDIKLVFMGTKHPNQKMVTMSMADRAVQLSNQLGLTGRTVFFNEGWVPYELRANYLLEADVGLSAHFDHLETRFSFRTRMLDYIWSELPIVATTGDAFADLIKAEGLGRVLPYQDPPKFASTIVDLLDAPTEIAQIKRNLQRLQTTLDWDVVSQPLDRLISAPRTTASPHRVDRVGYWSRRLGVMLRHDGIGPTAHKALRRLRRP